MVSTIELNPDGTFPFQSSGCECCLPKTYSVTTTVGHKWTKEEIEEQILWLAEELVNAKWYNRKRVRLHLKHWVEKLDRYKELKSEFN